MAMETNPAGVNNVSPVERTQPISNNSTVSNKRVGDQASSPFQPQTHVTIENSVADMLNVLSKAATETVDGTQKIPAELQKFINTLLQNSFSIDSSLSEGLGSVLQSQRFTLDQLHGVAKILDQMGTLAEMDQSNLLPDDLKTLLSNLTQLDGNNGKTLNSVNLMKIAFQLLDGKSVEDLPAQLQLLLGNSSTSMPALPQAETESLGFLKQLVKMFLPTPSFADNTTLLKDPSMNTSSQNQQNMGQSNLPSSSVPTPQQKLGSGNLPNENKMATPTTKQPMSAGANPRNIPQTAIQSLASATYAMQKKFGGINENLLTRLEDLGTEMMDKQNGNSTQNNQSGVNSQGKGQATTSPMQQNIEARTLPKDVLNQPFVTKGEAAIPASGTKAAETEMMDKQNGTSTQNNQSGINPQGKGQATTSPMQQNTEARTLPKDVLNQPLLAKGEATIPASGTKAAETEMMDKQNGTSTQNNQSGVNPQEKGQATTSSLLQNTEARTLPKDVLNQPLLAKGEAAIPASGTKAAETEVMDKQNGTGTQNNQSGVNPQGKGQVTTSPMQQNAEARTLPNDTLNQPFSTKSDAKIDLSNPNMAALDENEMMQTQPKLQNPAGSLSNQANPTMMKQFLSSSVVNSQTLSQLLAAPLENTEQTMQTMKNLANQLMNTSSLDEKSLTLLKNFVNDKQEMMPEQDAKQLQLLLRLNEKNIPPSISQAAIKQNLPELPKLWTFVQLCDLSELKDMQAHEFKNASKNMDDFASLLRKSMGNENSISENHRSMAFMTPLYLGENQKNYPTYVHIYDQSENETGQNNEKKETWLRLCLLTENIGAVEMVFRLYEKENINVRVSFSNTDMVESFNQYIPELKASFENYPLVLKDFKVRAIGE